MRLVLESTTKDLNVIQEQLRDTEKTIDEAKVEVYFFCACDCIIFTFIVYTVLALGFILWETKSVLASTRWFKYDRDKL
jgi:hypothetical protein